MTRLTPLTAALVFLIAAAGFALSYQALHAYALANGISLNLAWLWPLVIDGFMIVISLSILRASLYQEPVKWLWTLAILATCVSIAFNIAHAPATFAGRAVATVAPVAMFAAFEVFIGQIRRNSERAGTQASYKKLQEQIKGLQAERQDLSLEMQSLVDKAQGEAQDIRNEIASLDYERQASALAAQEARNVLVTLEKEADKSRRELARLDKEIASALQDDTRSKLMMYFKVNPSASQTDAAEFAGVSRARVGQYLTQFQQAGILNGKAHQPAGNGAGE